MTELRELLLDLVAGLPDDDGTGLRVSEAELSIPVEWQLRAGGKARFSAPRGTLATGFDPPHGQLRVTLERVEP